jgi:hypothetical protein
VGKKGGDVAGRISPGGFPVIVVFLVFLHFGPVSERRLSDARGTFDGCRSSCSASVCRPRVKGEGGGERW